jgi:hypothetical protein
MVHLHASISDRKYRHSSSMVKALIILSAVLLADMAFIWWAVGRKLDWDGNSTILGGRRHGRG